jgi:hypothetical protein
MNVLNKQMLLHKNLICSKKNNVYLTFRQIQVQVDNKIINLQNVINSFAKKVLKIVLRRLFSYRETHKKSNAIFNWQVGTFNKLYFLKD